MKSIIFTLAILITLCLTSAIWHVHQAREREQIRHLNRIIMDQQEELWRKKVEVRNLWVLKNQAWNELGRRKK